MDINNTTDFGAVKVVMLKGDKGDTGISPNIEVETIAGGHKVIITDATGTQEFEVLDGEASANNYNNLSNKPKINNVELSGNKSFTDLGLLDIIYPVGSILYNSNSSFNPNTAFGGTWRKKEGVFIVGADANHPIGQTSGNSSITLNENNLPACNFSIRMNSNILRNGSSETQSRFFHSTTGKAVTSTHTGQNVPVGNASVATNKEVSDTVSVEYGKVTPDAINIEPFSYAVNIWERIS